MVLSIAELRAKVAQQNQVQAASTNYSSTIFSFSDLKPGDQVKIRFIEDNDKNDVFWRTRCTRALRFPSIRLANGSVVDNQVFVDIPAFNRKPGPDPKHENDFCLPDNYVYQSKDDAVNTRIKPLWDGTPEGTIAYNKFGRQARRIFQGFIRTEGYETKLYRFVINQDLFNIIYSYMDDDELVESGAQPCDVVHGREFILKVTEKVASINGISRTVKDYSTSKWSSKESPLTAEEQAYLQANASYTLKDFIPARPSIEQEKIMLEMFEASYNNEPYDVVKWGKIFKPNNVQFDEQGNIKDVKNNSKMNAAQTVTESPVSQSVAQTVAPTVSNETVQTNPLQGMTAEQISALLAATQNTYAGVNAQPQPVSNPTAPQLINEHTVKVEGENPNDVIANIMGKFGINQQ